MRRMTTSALIISLLTVICVSSVLEARIEIRQSEVSQILNGVQSDTLFIFGEEYGPAEHLLNTRAIIDLDSDGFLWVLDCGNTRLLVLDPNGNLTREYSREGEGPGEYKQPAALRTIESIAITWDARNRQLSSWSRQAGLLEAKRMNPPIGARYVSRIGSDGELWTMGTDRSRVRRDQMPASVFRTDETGSSDELIEILLPINQSSDGRATAYGWSPSICHAPWGGFIVSRNIEYELAWISAEGVKTWKYPSLKVPYQDDEIEEILRMPRARTMYEEVFAPILPHKPDIQALLCVSANEVWVKTSVTNSAGMARYDRLNHVGDRVSESWFDTAWEQIKISQDRMYVLTRSEEGTPVIIGFRR